jgi:rod shape-determining protein MreC
LSGKRRRIRLVAVFVAIFVFLSLPIGVSRSVKEFATGFFTPLFSVTSSIGDRLSDIWNAAFHSDNLVRDSLRKEREVLKLRAELNQAREKIRELGSFYAQLEELEKAGVLPIPAKVIGREPDSWYQTLLINRGVRHGVGRGMPVVHGENLVGRVIEAGGRWSRVRLILDPASAIPALTRDGKTTGIVIGVGPQPLKMTYIEHNAKLEPNDPVVTAHLEEVLTQDEAPLPQGLVIGRILDVSREEEGLYQSATLKSAVNFRNLSEVLVLVPK